jgi:hypothetical protein
MILQFSQVSITITTCNAGHTRRPHTEINERVTAATPLRLA